jgi:Zn-dependent metalloprotease
VSTLASSLEDRMSRFSQVHRLLRFETLEDRRLLAAFFWSAASEHAWGPTPLAAEAESFAPNVGALFARFERFAEPHPMGPLPATATVNRGATLVEHLLGAAYPVARTADAFLHAQQQRLAVADPHRELLPFDGWRDSLDMTHIRYAQHYEGVTVYGAEVFVHLGADGQVNSANGHLLPITTLDATPTLTSDAALSIAVGQLQNEYDGVAEPEHESSELYILDLGFLEHNQPSGTRLVWEVRLVEFDTMIDDQYFVDAHNGEIVWKTNGIRYADWTEGREIRDCSRRNAFGHPACELDVAAGGHVYGRSEGMPPTGLNPRYDRSDVDDIYDLFGFTEEFFRDRYGRNGGNDRGGLGDPTYTFFAPWTTSLVYAYAERVWDTCPANFYSFMTICTGDATPDIIGHEFAHAIPRHSHLDANGIAIGMTYRGQAGALEENFSDLVGEAIESAWTGENNDWVSGTDRAFQEPARSMADPPSFSYRKGELEGLPYPDRFHHENVYCGLQDNGGVHWNANIVNKAAYLVAEGGSFNGYEITGRGIMETLDIWYRAITTYYARNETFNGAFRLLPQAAEDLYGREAAHQVRLALQSVEMHLPGKCYSGPAGIAVGPTSRLITDENGRQDVFNIVLKKRPAAHVTLHLTSSNEGEGTVSPSSVTFTPEDWNTIRTITVTGVADGVVDGEATYQILIGPAVSDDPVYRNRKPDDVLVTNLDDDSPAIRLSKTQASVAEDGQTDAVSVWLNAMVEADVVVTVASGNLGEVSVDPVELLFTPETWNIAQPVLLAGVDDGLLDGDQTTAVVFRVLNESSDSRMHQAAEQVVWVTSVDNGYHGWQNQLNRYDVDGSGHVTPADVLALINQINRNPGNPILPPPPSEPPDAYYDVNNDGAVTAEDVLLVINHLNRAAREPAESEATNVRLGLDTLPEIDAALVPRYCGLGAGRDVDSNVTIPRPSRGHSNGTLPNRSCGTAPVS